MAFLLNQTDKSYYDKNDDFHLLTYLLVVYAT